MALLYKEAFLPNAPRSSCAYHTDCQEGTFHDKAFLVVWGYRRLHPIRSVYVVASGDIFDCWSMHAIYLRPLHNRVNFAVVMVVISK